MLSKAFLRSMKHACTFPLFFFCICMSCSITNAWVEHEWYFLNPAWFGDRMLLSFVCFSSFWYSSLSTTFVHTFVSEIGLCCIGFLASYLSFGMRKIFAAHIPIGTSCFLHIRETRFTVISSATFPPYFSISAVILSGPGAFFIGRWSMMYLMFCLAGASLSTLLF